MSDNIQPHKYRITRAQREKMQQHKGKVIWLTGLSGAGKSTLANQLELELFSLGFRTYVLDGDNLRVGLNHDLKFSQEDRKENLRRVAEVAKLFVDAGIVVIAAFITPYEKDRARIKEIIGEEDYVQVYVDCPLEICEERDVKGLYARARNGEIKDFTGIDAPFEEPEHNDLVIKTSKFDLKESLIKLVSLSLQKIKQS